MLKYEKEKYDDSDNYVKIGENESLHENFDQAIGASRSNVALKVNNIMLILLGKWNEVPLLIWNVA